MNRGLEELRKYGLAATDLLPPVRLAGREPAPRLILESGDQPRPLAHLRELVTDVRKLGERGLDDHALQRAWAKWTPRSYGRRRSTRRSGRCCACSWTTP